MKPEDVIEVAPGSTKYVDIQVFNDTLVPWKKGSKLVFDTEQVMTDCPIEPIFLDIDQKVKGKQYLSLSVPLTVNPQAVCDPDAIHTIHLAFKGPKG